jgi:hypothetical protein
MTPSQGKENSFHQRQELWHRRERQLELENDRLDQELDAALARYAAVEPRPGLEQRLLANLRAECEPPVVRVGWRWLASGAVSVVVLMLALAPSWRTEKPQLGKTTAHSASQGGRNKQIAKIASQPRLLTEHPASAQTAVTNRPRQPRAVVPVAPHLEQFPSPQPLSRQEQILARYVATNPEHAALIAAARAEALRRDAVEEMRDASSEQNIQP